jgi:CRISPR-associated protein Csd1
LHYADIGINKKDSDSDIISPWRILVNTAVAGKNDNIPPLLESALMRSILNGSAYPFNLYTAILNRAKAERKRDFVRAGILKGYLNRIARENHKPEKEMMTMPLNEDETNPGYLLGRLMAVLEKAQKDALGDVNSSIMDKYLNSAMSNPETVFPTLLKLFEKHVNKSERYFAKKGRYAKKRVAKIIRHFESQGFPQTLDFNDQGRFLIGYYHQNAQLYTKKSTPEKEN